MGSKRRRYRNRAKRKAVAALTRNQVPVSQFWHSNLFVGLATLVGAVIAGLFALYAAGRFPFQPEMKPMAANNSTSNSAESPQKTYEEFLKNSDTTRDDTWHVTAIRNQTDMVISYMTLGPNDQLWKVSTTEPSDKHIYIEKGSDLLFQFMDSTGNTYWLKSTKLPGNKPSEADVQDVKANTFVSEESSRNGITWHLFYDGQEIHPIKSENIK